MDDSRKQNAIDLIIESIDSKITKLLAAKAKLEDLRSSGKVVADLEDEVNELRL